MAWSASAQHRAAIADIWGKVSGIDLDADVLKIVLYDNSITPDKDVTLANSAHAAGVWASGIVSDTNWPSAGIALPNKVISTPASGRVRLLGDTVPSAGTVTVASVTGVHVYDDTITTPTADPGICYNYLGGAAGVTAGSFSVAWDTTNGIMYASV